MDLNCSGQDDIEDGLPDFNAALPLAFIITRIFERRKIPREKTQWVITLDSNTPKYLKVG